MEYETKREKIQKELNQQVSKEENLFTEIVEVSWNI